MPIDITAETQQRLAERMANLGYATHDEVINSLLDETDDVPAGPPWLEGLPSDEELDTALDEADRTGGTPIEVVREQLRKEFGLDQL